MHPEDTCTKVGNAGQGKAAKIMLKLQFLTLQLITDRETKSSYLFPSKL